MNQPAQVPVKKRFPRELDGLEDLVSFTDQFFRDGSVDSRLRFAVDLCIEELFVNMVRYNRETVHPIQLELATCEQGVKITLTDYDVERFDPRSAPAADVGAPLEQRQPGGLGLFLVMKMVDSIHYEYANRESKISVVISDGAQHV